MRRPYRLASAHAAAAGPRAVRGPFLTRPARRASAEQVAIKKITKAYEDLVDAKRILREVKLLHHMRHDNVSSAARARRSGGYPARCTADSPAAPSLLLRGRGGTGGSAGGQNSHTRAHATAVRRLSV